MKSILDSTFRYTPSFDTDLAKKFAMLRHEQRRQRGTVSENVVTIKSKNTLRGAIRREETGTLASASSHNKHTVDGGAAA